MANFTADVPISLRNQERTTWYLIEENIDNSTSKNTANGTTVMKQNTKYVYFA